MTPALMARIKTLFTKSPTLNDLEQMQKYSHDK